MISFLKIRATIFHFHSKFFTCTCYICSLNPNFHHVNEVKFPVYPSCIPCPWHCPFCFQSIKGSSYPIFLTVWHISIQPPKFRPLDSKQAGEGCWKNWGKQASQTGLLSFLDQGETGSHSPGGCSKQAGLVMVGQVKRGNIFLRQRGEPATRQKTIVWHITFSLSLWSLIKLPSTLIF